MCQINMHARLFGTLEYQNTNEWRYPEQLYRLGMYVYVLTDCCC